MTKLRLSDQEKKGLDSVSISMTFRLPKRFYEKTKKRNHPSHLLTNATVQLKAHIYLSHASKAVNLHLVHED